MFKRAILLICIWKNVYYILGMLLNVFASSHYSNGPFKYLAPLSIQYPQKQYTLNIYDTVYPIKPILSQPVYQFTIEPSLPSGIRLDTETGIISGYCFKIVNETYTITAHLNKEKKASTKIYFTVSAKPILSKNNAFNFRFDDNPNCPTLGRKYNLDLFPSAYTTSTNYYDSYFVIPTKLLATVSPLLTFNYKMDNIKSIDIQINSNSILKDKNIEKENDNEEEENGKIIMNIPTEYIRNGRNEITIIIQKIKPSNENNLFNIDIKYNIEDYKNTIREYNRRVLEDNSTLIHFDGLENETSHNFILGILTEQPYTINNDYCVAIIQEGNSISEEEFRNKYGIILDIINKKLSIKPTDRTDSNITMVLGVYKKIGNSCLNKPATNTKIVDRLIFDFKLSCPKPTDFIFKLSGVKAYKGDYFSYTADIYFTGGTIEKCPNNISVTENQDYFYNTMELKLTQSGKYHFVSGTPKVRDLNFNFTVTMYNADAWSNNYTVFFPIYYSPPKNMKYDTEPVIMWYHYNYPNDTDAKVLNVTVDIESEPIYKIVENEQILNEYGVYINETTGSLYGYPIKRTIFNGSNVRQAIEFTVSGTNEGGTKTQRFNVRILYGPPKDLEIEPTYIYMELEENIKAFDVSCYDCFILNYTQRLCGADLEENDDDKSNKGLVEGSGLGFDNRPNGQKPLDPPYIDYSDYKNIYTKDRDISLYLSNDTSAMIFKDDPQHKGEYTYCVSACNDEGCSKPVEIVIEIICPIVKNFTYEGGYYENAEIINQDYNEDFIFYDFEEIGKNYSYIFLNGSNVEPDFSPYPDLHLKLSTLNQCNYTYELEDSSILEDVGVDFNENDGKFYGTPYDVTNITAYNITVYNEVENGTLDQEYIWVVYPIPGKIYYNKYYISLRVYLDWLDVYPIHVDDYVQAFRLKNEGERISFLNQHKLDYSINSGRFWGLVNSSFAQKEFQVFAQNYRGNSTNYTSIFIDAYCVEAQNLTYEELNYCNINDTYEELNYYNISNDPFCFREGYLKAYVGDYIGVFKPTFWSCDYMYLYCDKELELRKSGIFFNRLTGDFQGNVTQPFPKQVVHFYVFNRVNYTAGTGISIPFNLTVYFTHPPPSNLRYNPNPVTFYVNVTINPMIPTIDGVVYNYTFDNIDDLEGLEFNTSTGIITGTPEETTDTPILVNITACNDEGCVYFVLNITIDILRENTIIYLPKKYIFAINDYSEIPKPLYYTQQSELLKFGISDYEYLTSIGFIFNTTDGSIKGTPTILVDSHEFNVTGYFNDSDNPIDTISIQVYDPYQFPVYIPESAVFDENSLHNCLNYTHPLGLPIICRLFNNITFNEEWETVPQFSGLIDGQFYSIIMKNHSLFQNESSGYYYHGLVHNLLGATVKDINFIIDTNGDENESCYLTEEETSETTDVGFIFSYSSKSHFYSILVKVEGNFYTNLTVENYALFVAHSYDSSFVKVMVESDGNVTINNIGSIGIMFCNGESVSIKNSYIHMNIVEYLDAVYAGLFAGVCTFCTFLNSFSHVEIFKSYVIYYGDFYISGFVGVSDNSKFINVMSTVGNIQSEDDSRFEGKVSDDMRKMQNQVISDLIGNSQSSNYFSCNTYSNHTKIHKSLKYGIVIGEDVDYYNNSISESYFKVYYDEIEKENLKNILPIRSNVTNSIIYVKPDLKDYFKNKEDDKKNKLFTKNVYILYNNDEYNLTNYDGVKCVKFNESLNPQLFDGLDFSIFGYWSYVVPYDIIKSLDDLKTSKPAEKTGIEYTKSVFQSRLPIRLELEKDPKFEYWPVAGNCYIVLDECWDVETWEVKTEKFPVLNRYRTEYHYEKPYDSFVDKYSTQCLPECNKQQQCIDYKCVCINGMKGLDCDIPFN